VLRRDPYSTDALLALGETLHARGLADDAATAFARVLRFDADHVGALYWEGVLRAERHHHRDAVARWKRVIELEPDGEYARLAHAAARAAAERVQLAMRAGARPTPARAARAAAGGR